MKSTKTKKPVTTYLNASGIMILALSLPLAACGKRYASDSCPHPIILTPEQEEKLIEFDEDFYLIFSNQQFDLVECAP